MPQSHQEPFWSIAMKLLPADSHLMEAVSEYLYMRIQKNPQLSVADWEACLNELIRAFVVPVKASDIRLIARQKKAQKTDNKPKLSIQTQDLTYYFIVATRRKWNHVYFTKEQDLEYSNNINFYQDIYWQRLINDPETRKMLEDELNGK